MNATLSPQKSHKTHSRLFLFGKNAGLEVNTHKFSSISPKKEPIFQTPPIDTRTTNSPKPTKLHPSFNTIERERNLNKFNTKPGESPIKTVKLDDLFMNGNMPNKLQQMIRASSENQKKKLVLRNEVEEKFIVNSYSRTILNLNHPNNLFQSLPPTTSHAKRIIDKTMGKTNEVEKMMRNTFSTDKDHKINYHVQQIDFQVPKIDVEKRMNAPALTHSNEVTENSTGLNSKPQTSSAQVRQKQKIMFKVGFPILKHNANYNGIHKQLKFCSSALLKKQENLLESINKIYFEGDNNEMDQLDEKISNLFIKYNSNTEKISTQSICIQTMCFYKFCEVLLGRMNQYDAL